MSSYSINLKNNFGFLCVITADGTFPLELLSSRLSGKLKHAVVRVQREVTGRCRKVEGATSSSEEFTGEEPGCAQRRKPETD